MKAIITGASSDIGKLIVDHFDFDWVPVDRTHGITLPDDADMIKEAIRHSDLFFNIAQFDTIQSDLLAMVWNVWNMQENKTPKKIISFGSIVTEMSMQTILDLNDFDYFNRAREKSGYIAEKLLLNKTHDEYKNLHLTGYNKGYALPQSILIKLGNVLYKELRSHEPYTTAEQLLNAIDYVVNNETYISDLELRWN